MKGRVLRFAWLAFLIVWYVGVMPGHTRGVVSIARPNCQAPAQQQGDTTQSCCALPDSPAEDAPEQDPAQRCLICFLRANLDLPTDIHFDPPGLEFEYELEAPPALVAQHTVETLDQVRGRPPPVVTL